MAKHGKNNYSMTMSIQKEGSKPTTFFYRLDDTNHNIDPIIKGWEEAGYLILSLEFVSNNNLDLMKNMNRLRIKLTRDYEISLIQPKGSASIEIALINPKGDIEEFSSALFKEPDQVHQNLSAQELVTAITRAEDHMRRND